MLSEAIQQDQQQQAESAAAKAGDTAMAEPGGTSKEGAEGATPMETDAAAEGSGGAASSAADTAAAGGGDVEMSTSPTAQASPGAFADIVVQPQHPLSL